MRRISSRALGSSTRNQPPRSVPAHSRNTTAKKWRASSKHRTLPQQGLAASAGSRRPPSQRSRRRFHEQLAGSPFHENALLSHSRSAGAPVRQRSSGG